MRGEPEAIVETAGLVGGYGQTLVLREVSLRVPRGSVFGLLGPNGAGKTTAMRMILGLLRPVRGTVRVFGSPLEPALPGVLRRMGALIEQPSLYDHLTGEENLKIARRLKFLGRGAAAEVVESLGIGGFVARCVREYSRGMRQRLGVAMAMLGGPELLLLDEPMNGLDAEALILLRAAIERARRERGTTVLLSSHQFDEVEQAATHIGILSASGDLLFQGAMADLPGRVAKELTVRVDREDEALVALRGAGYAARAADGRILICHASNDMARDVNRLLVGQGIGVHHLALDTSTLEALFTKVTKTVKAWDMA